MYDEKIRRYNQLIEDINLSISDIKTGNERGINISGNTYEGLRINNEGYEKETTTNIVNTNKEIINRLNNLISNMNSSIRELERAKAEEEEKERQEEEERKAKEEEERKERENKVKNNKK